MIKIINTRSITAASLLLMNPVLAGANSLDEAINLAKAEVNRQLGISETEIRVVQSQAAEWPNSSLGCPKKGMQYQPVITSGHVMKLMTATHTYTVHVADERAVICDGPTGTARQRLPVRDEKVLSLVKLARENLKARVDEPSLPIRLMALTPTRWPDASLGCAETDKEYLQVETAGYVIELEHDGKQFAYHASTDRVVLCEKPQ